MREFNTTANQAVYSFKFFLKSPKRHSVLILLSTFGVFFWINMFYYPHHIGDFTRETARLSDSQCMAYLRLLWIYYDTEKPLTGSIEKLAFLVGSNVTDTALILDHYFIFDGESYRHTRCDKELAAYDKKSETARNAANARWNNAHAMQTHNSRNADALKNDANQEPRTKNQEPSIKEKSADAPILPSWMPLDAWVGFVEMRKRIKKPMTDRAVCLKIKDLEKFRKDGYDIGAILDKSTANNWSDLYEPKPMRGKSGHVNKQEALEASNRAVVERLLAKEAAYAQQ